MHQKSKAYYIKVTEGEEGQRIDNYLINRLKTMPKSRLYRILRKGEVRVNHKRVIPSYRLMEGDSVRIPPVRLEDKADLAPPSAETSSLLKNSIIYEDEFFIILNKPSGMSVHAGSTVRLGVIEAMKWNYPQYPQLELAHRLDSETSGCLILVKKKRMLRELHHLLRDGQVKKIYQTLTKGHWADNELIVDQPLHKHYRDKGKHVVEVKSHGKAAVTQFKLLKPYSEASLMEVNLLTGRTHQIRVHAAYHHHPIAGDDRYGDEDFNKQMRKCGLKRLFLHAHAIDFVLPSNGQRIKVTAPLDETLLSLLYNLQENDV